MPALFRSTRRIEFHHTDAAGIVHFSKFFLFMEEVEHEFLRSRGLSVMMRDAQGVMSWPRVAASCQYRSTVKFEDLLDIELTIDRVLSVSSLPHGLIASCWFIPQGWRTTWVSSRYR